MRAPVTLLGSTGDALGFKLAGVKARTPRDRAELEAALAELEGARDLVLVSAEVAALAPDVVAAFAAAEGAPILLVLPEGAR